MRSVVQEDHWLHKVVSKCLGPVVGHNLICLRIRMEAGDANLAGVEELMFLCP